MVAVFQNISNTEFTLNGIAYDKVFIALPVGQDAIRVVGVYDSCLCILGNTQIQDISVNGSTYGSITTLIQALKPLLYFIDDPGGGGGLPASHNYIGKKLYTLDLHGIDTTQEERQYIADTINRGDISWSVQGVPFTVLNGQEFLFRTVTAGSSGNLRIKTYGLYAMLPEVGGVGGTTISKEDIYVDGQENINVSGASDVVTHFGEIGSTPIEDKVNEGENGGNDPYDIQGFHVFDCLRSGTLHIYVFIGAPGLYGGNNMGTGGIMEAFEEDFMEITDDPAPDPGGSGIPEAPVNNEPHVRMNANWEKLFDFDLDSFENASNDPYARNSDLPTDLNELTDNQKLLLPAVKVLTQNTTLQENDNNIIFITPQYDITINPNTNDYGSSYAVAVKNPDQDNDIIGISKSGVQYQVNDESPVNSGTFTLSAGGTCAIVYSDVTKIFYIDGDFE